MAESVAQSLWTHLEIPTKLLIEIEVMGASPRCSTEHFPAVTESIADRRDRLKKNSRILRSGY